MANTLNLDGGDKSITRSVIKFIIHERYNPNTYVIAYYDTSFYAKFNFKIIINFSGQRHRYTGVGFTH